MSKDVPPGDDNPMCRTCMHEQPHTVLLADGMLIARCPACDGGVCYVEPFALPGTGD
jgi:hypothetical protein